MQVTVRTMLQARADIPLWAGQPLAQGQMRRAVA